MLSNLNPENYQNLLLSNSVDSTYSRNAEIVNANARPLESISSVGKEVFDIAYAANGNDTNPTIYAAARTGVIASEDGGVNWKVTPGLFPGEVRSLVVINRDTLVASSNGRVYISRDAARTWYEFGRGLAAAPQSTANLFYVNNHLVLASQSGWFVCPNLSCDGATTGLDAAKVPDRNWDFSGDVGLDAKRQVDVIEYYQSALNHYFVTSDPAEMTYLDKNVASLGWARTGSRFRAWYPQTSAFAVDVCRFYGSVSPGPNSHFYSADTNECQQLHRLEAASAKSVPRWNFEAVAFSVEPVGQDGQCRAGRVPIYRAYNNGNKKGIDSNHRYSASIGELNRLVAAGWSIEGKAFCALS